MLMVKIRFWLPGRFVVAGFRGDLEKMLSPTGDRWFESISLQQRVHCEPVAVAQVPMSWALAPRGGPVVAMAAAARKRAGA